MAAITLLWATPVTTRGTVTGTTPTMIAEITSGNFVAGEKYLIIAHGLFDGPTASDFTISDLYHGTTAFGLEHSLEHPNSGTAKGAHHCHWTVWTAVASEDIEFRAWGQTAGVVVGYDQVTLSAIRLTGQGLTQGTDWDFAEVATDVANSLTPLTTGASLTVTPPAGSDFLVATLARLSTSSLTVNYGSRIFSSGTINDTQPSADREGEDAATTPVICHFRPFINLGAVSRTFREESFNKVGASGNRLHSQVFWLRLNAFKERTVAFTAADEVLGTTDWADPFQTGIAITPSVTGTIFCLASAVFDADVLGHEVVCRLQTNNTDTPATQTTDLKQEQEVADPIDEMEFHRQWSQAGTASTLYTFDFEGDLSGTAGTPHVQQRSMTVFVTELASVTPKSMTFAAQPHMLHLLVR